MFFTVLELVRWLGMTLFEMTLNVVCLFVFTILCVLKNSNILTSSWWTVFIPLFIANGLNAYLYIIIFIRACDIRDNRWAALRLCSSMMILSSLFAFEFLFCKKLTGQSDHRYSEVFAPTFVPLFILMIRSCQLH